MHRAPVTSSPGNIGERWQPASDGFLGDLLDLPELALVEESCPAERRLHHRLVAAPTCAVSAAELAALADDDVRDNYATFLAFRDDVVRAGTIEAHYLRLVRSGKVALPPVFLDRMVAAIVAPLVDGSADMIEHRAAQLLYRAQRVAIVDGRVLSADREHADSIGGTSHGLDLVRDLAAGGGGVAGMPILGPTNTHAFATATGNRHAFVLDLSHEIANDLGHGLSFTMTRAGSGLAALARVLERWILHFHAVRTTIRPVQRIDDPAWRWHLGLDAEASVILNALYRGETPEADEMERLIGLFRLDFGDPREMRADVAGKPVYLGLAIDRERMLKVKPQNLLVNLPLATVT
jgi:hypothetical protein